MAGSATIGALHVSLGIDSANFTKGQSQSSFQKFGKQMAVVGAAISGAVTARARAQPAFGQRGLGIGMMSGLLHVQNLRLPFLSTIQQQYTSTSVQIGADHNQKSGANHAR